MQLTPKLLSYLHRIFSTEADQFLALRLSHADGLAWRVADARLTTTVPGNPAASLDIDLSQYTVASLIDFLATQPGYTIEYGDQSELAALSARVLIDGENDISRSNGDHLYGYTSILWSYMEAMAVELQEARRQIVEALKQLNTKTAQGEWLDLLGSYYKVPRLQGEFDSSYGPRIIAEVLRPRANNVAMEEAIRVFTGQETKVTDVTLYGDAFPLYNSVISYNGVYRHDAARQPLYGLFDVEYGYDLEGSEDIVQFAQIIRDLINRLRDAGTHLRSLLLRGSDMTDSVTAPTDAPEIPWVADGAFTEAFAAPDDPDFSSAVALGDLADTFVEASEDAGSLVAYNYQYNGVRSRNGAIRHMGDRVVVENTDGTSPVELFSAVRAGGRVLDPSISFTRASVGTYVDHDGLIKTAAENVPRVDHDPITGQAKGLLIEDVRTNLAIYSAAVIPGWLGGGSPVVTANFGPSPSGANDSGFLSTSLVAGGVPYTGPGSTASVSYVAGQTYTASVWLKIDPGMPSKRVRLLLHTTPFGSNKAVYFDVSNGSVSVISGTTVPEGYGSQAYQGGWVRVWITQTATATVDSYPPLVWFFDSILPGEGVQFWGIQIEAGTNPTSLIPTSGAAATRDGDRAVMPTADWFNPSEGTFFADYEILEINADGTILAANNATQNEQIDMRVWSTQSGPRVRSGGVNQSSWALGTTPVPGVTYRMAIAYAANDQNAALNGALGAVDTACNVPAGVFQMEIGRRAGSGRLKGRVKRILYCPRRLADSQMATATA